MLRFIQDRDNIYYVWFWSRNIYIKHSAMIKEVARTQAMMNKAIQAIKRR